MRRSPYVGLGGVWLCAALSAGAGVGLAGPALGQGASTPAAVSAERQREGRLAYETGLLLHEQGEYEAAIGVLIESIAADPSREEAYRALTAAQVEGAQARLALALDAADGGDLPAAARHARKAAELDGENHDAVAAARSITDPSAVLTAAQHERFDQAQSLTDDRQWGLARRQLAALVAEAPLFLPGRSALQRAAYFEGRANAMANEGVALMQQHRLTPAVEQLSGAVGIWPYHPDAGASLEQALAGQRRAVGLAEDAVSAMGEDELDTALDLARQALAVDSANAQARGLERDARRSLAQRATTRGNHSRQAERYDAARDHYHEALDIVPGYPDARRGLAQTYLGQGRSLADEGRPGAALLAYLAGGEHDRRAVRGALADGEQALLGRDELAVSYAIDVPDHTSALGVGSAGLLAELRTQRHPDYLRRGVDADETRYGVRVRITDTDITLRRVRSASSSYYSTGGVASGYTRWEKRGGVDCTVTITDRATGAVVDTWDANRWVTFSDTQQYVVGSSLQRSYWTLPSDSAIADRLARDLADAVWPAVRDRLTLARAQALLAESVELSAAGDADAALEREVAATVLAGQVNGREGERALRELARRVMGE